MQNTVSKEYMDSLKVLADTNMKISEAKGILSKLQETETDYLVGRETKALDRIEKVHEESSYLLKETKDNYREVHSLLNTASTLVQFIGEITEKFEGMITDFNARNEAWEERIKESEKVSLHLKNEIKADQIQVANDKKSLASQTKNLEKLKVQIESRQAALKVALKVENELWNKITKKN